MSAPKAQNSSRLFVRVHPGKKSDRFYLVNEEFHVDLSSRAIEGQANQHLMRFLGKILSIPPSSLVIERGLSSRYKEVSVPISQEDLMARVRGLS
ncbi:MAG: DUF167 domain-containing protein [Leptospirillum sp.]